MVKDLSLEEKELLGWIFPHVSGVTIWSWGECKQGKKKFSGAFLRAGKNWPQWDRQSRLEGWMRVSVPKFSFCTVQ